MKKKLIAIALAIIITMGFAVPAFAAAAVTDFTDVSANAWYYGAVDYTASHGLFSGTSATTFSPDVTMSRGMFITVLGRLANVPDSYGRTQTTPFTDVTQADYFFPYAAWAKDNSILENTGSQFNPNRDISREDMTTYLYRYAVNGSYNTAYSAEKYDTFSDTAKVSSYAVTAMQWATAHSVINGSDGKLNPQASATRAQVAQIFLNFSRLEAAAPDEPDTEPADWENYNPTYNIPTGKSAVDASGGYYDYDLANEIMEQVNALRVKNGLDALLYHPKIQEWASIRAQEQVSREGHTRPDGSVYSSVGVGLTFENINILWNSSESALSNVSALAERAVNSWYASTKGHKEAMLSSAPNLGAIACYVRGNNVYIAHLFSNRTLYFMDYLI